MEQCLPLKLVSLSNHPSNRHTLLPHSSTSLLFIGNISNIIFENIIGRGENGVVVSSRLGAPPIQSVYFKDVHLTVTTIKPLLPGINYSRPAHDFRPAQSPDRIFTPPPTQNVYFFENVQTVVMDEVTGTFNNQPVVLGHVCVNSTDALQMKQLSRSVGCMKQKEITTMIQ